MQITSRETGTSWMWAGDRESLKRTRSEAVSRDQREQHGGQGSDEDGEEGDPVRGAQKRHCTARQPQASARRNDDPKWVQLTMQICQ